MKRTITFFLLTMLASQLFTFDTYAQCTWKTKLYDDFEYTGVCPYVIPGTTYGSSTATWTAHSGGRSLYMNFVNCVSGVGTCTGDTFFIRPIAVCQGTDYRISSYFTTTFSGLQCNIRIVIYDKNHTVLDSLTSLAAAYSPIWSHYVSASFTPATDSIYFMMTVNTGGGAGGNDLSMDEFLVENCDNVSFDIGGDTAVCAQSINLTAGNGFNSYLWSNGGTTSSITDSVTVTTPVYHYVTVYVTNGFGCVYGDSLWVQFNYCVGLNGFDFNNQFNVYPNPASNRVTIKLYNLPSKECYFSLYDITGREVMKQEINKLEQTISFNEMNSGLYLYRIAGDDKILGSGKLMME